MTVMEYNLCVCLAELLVMCISVYVYVYWRGLDACVWTVFEQMLTVYCSWNHFTYEWWVYTLILIHGIYPALHSAHRVKLVCVCVRGGAPLIAFQTVHSVS